MIGRLCGVILVKQPPALVLDVNGVGYEVDAPMSTFYSLPEINEKAILLIHTHVREDALQLYGFATEAERTLFKTLIKISGVGAKLALTILSGIDVVTFKQCVEREDSAALTRLPGVGKKTAERLVVEMKDKLDLPSLDSSNVSLKDAVLAEPRAANPIEEAVTALIALGYRLPEASRMVSAVNTEGAQTEDLIRLALQTSVQ